MPPTPPSPPACAALIPAAGEGRRLGGVLKPFLLLSGKPLLVWSLEVFRRSPMVGEIVVALPPDRLDSLEREWGKRLRDAGATRLVAGGPRRQDSVRAAFDAVAENLDIVLIHDAARPFVTVDLVERVALAASRTGAALLAAPSPDTVKESGDGRFVSKTIPRSSIFLAQTPQAARTSLLREAFARAEREGWEVTDEAELIERFGAPVEIVLGSETNLKITTPDDLCLAEALAKGIRLV